jgi:hypothetical protein
LNQSLEKIIIIGLNLTLLLTIGVPLLFSTTHVLTQSEQMVTFQNFVQDVDQSIITADQERGFLSRPLFVPNNVTVEPVNDQLIFKIYLDDWHIVTRTYRCHIQVIGTFHSGNYQLSVNSTESLILVNFEPL